eukprot:773890-Rhodomonas_salina.1
MVCADGVRPDGATASGWPRMHRAVHLCFVRQTSRDSRVTLRTQIPAEPLAGSRLQATTDPSIPSSPACTRAGVGIGLGGRDGQDAEALRVTATGGGSTTQGARPS